MSDPASSKRWPDLGLAVVAGIAIVWAFVTVFRHSPLGAFVPSFSDEVVYYKQAAGFVKAGFSHGHWGPTTPRPLIGACDIHGCGFMVATGSFGRVFGWSFPTALLFNFACLGAASLVTLLLWRPRGVRAVLIVALLLSCGVVITYVHAVMQEVFHVAAAVAFAVVAHRLARAPTLRWLIAYFALGTALALVRISWGAYLPLVALLVPEFSRGRRIRLALLGVLVAFGVYQFNSLMIPRSGLITISSSAGPAITHVIVNNLRELFSHVEPLYLSFRIAWLALLVLPVFRRFRPGADRSGAATVTWAWLGLIACTVMQVAFYDCFGWRDYRVLSPPIAALVVALASLADPRPARVLLVLQLLLVPMAVRQAHEWNDMRVDPARSEADRRALGTLLPPIEELRPTNHWCRTIAWSPPIDWQRMLALPDGLGVVTLRDPSEAADHPAHFLVTSGPPPPGLRLLGTWAPDLFVYERATRRCRL